MAAGLDPLGGDEVAVGGDCRDGFLAGTDLPAGERAAAVDEVDEGGVGVGVEEVADPRPRRCCGHGGSGVVGGDEVDDEVGGDRPRRSLSQSVERVADDGRRDPVDRDRAQPAGFGDGGRQRGIGEVAHPRLPDRDRAAGQLREARRRHRPPPAGATSSRSGGERRRLARRTDRRRQSVKPTVRSNSRRSPWAKDVVAQRAGRLGKVAPHLRFGGCRARTEATPAFADRTTIGTLTSGRNSTRGNGMAEPGRDARR